MKLLSQKNFFRSDDIKEKIKYLRLVSLLVKRELKVKYRSSFLGYLWSLLNPLMHMIVLSAVFSHLVRNIDNYSAYVFSGILMWNMLSMTLNMGAQSIINGGSLLKKVRMPIWIFPVSSLCSSAVNFGLSLIAYVVLAVYSQVILTSDFYLFPVILGLFFCFLLGLSLFLSIANVYFRDVGHVIEPLLTIGFYASPIIYDPQNLGLPQRIEAILKLNPLGYFARGIRSCLMGYGRIELSDIAVMTILTLISLTVGIATYKKARGKVIYNL